MIEGGEVQVAVQIEPNKPMLLRLRHRRTGIEVQAYGSDFDVLKAQALAELEVQIAMHDETVW